jgi:hypothetical protein
MSSTPLYLRPYTSTSRPLPLDLDLYIYVRLYQYIYSVTTYAYTSTHTSTYTIAYIDTDAYLIATVRPRPTRIREEAADMHATMTAPHLLESRS